MSTLVKAAERPANWQFVLPGSLGLLCVVGGVARGLDLVAAAVVVLVVLSAVARSVAVGTSGFTPLIVTGYTLLAFVAKSLLNGSNFGVSASTEKTLLLALLAGCSILSGFILFFLIANLRLPHSNKSVGPRTGVQRGRVFSAFAVLVVLRLFTGFLFSVGRPGRLPASIPGVGMLFSIPTYGALVCVAVLNVPTPKRSQHRLDLYSIVIYGVTGALLGWRSYIFTASLAALIGRYASARKTGIKLRKPATVMASGLLFLLVLSFAIGLRSESGTLARPVEVAQFFLDRVGGVSYAEPSVRVIDQVGGPSTVYLVEENYSRFLKIAVYGLPAWAVTAFAGTSVGYTYAALGVLGTVVVHLVLGFLLATGEWSLLSARNSVNGLLFFGLGEGLLFAAVNFLLEGTRGASVRTLLSMAATGLVLHFLCRLDNRGPAI